ncbi:MAG: T9SS type A sorting domain-containing protein, partial [Bacteroidales bacterium]|nr:T9SS type A sorting domain-containing protein [Bacteroidales bacterium]
NSVILNWTGGENANYFIVEYGKVGEEPQQENTPNATFTIHNVQEGNYFWRVKSVCSFGESNFVNGENITTGVNEWGDGHFTVYPNPTTGMVNVQFIMNNVQLKDVDIQIFDVYGRLLNTVETCHGASLQTTQIDLSSYAPGVYLIHMVGDGRVIGVRKVVKR